MAIAVPTQANFSSGITIEKLIEHKVPQHIQLHDDKNNGFNIIYLGNTSIENINKNFILLSEQYVKPLKYSFLGKTILYKVPEKKDVAANMVLSKVRTSLKPIMNKPVVFDLEPLYQTIFTLFHTINKNQVKLELEKLINSITQDLNTKYKSPNLLNKRKTILLINENNFNLESLKNNTVIDSAINLIKHFIIFNIPFNSNIDGIVFYNEKNNLFYPLTLEKTNSDKLIFNKVIFNRLVQDISKENNIPIKVEDLYSITKTDDLKKETEINKIELNNVHKQELQDLLKEIESGKLDDDTITSNLKKIENITNLYPGSNFEDKLKNVFNYSIDEKNIKPITAVDIKKIENLEKIKNDGTDPLEIYNGDVFLENNKVLETMQKVFNPIKITGLTRVSSINKQKTEMFEKLDKNIKNLTETFKQDPELNTEILDITSKLIENNKDRFIEYKVKLKHDYLNTTKKPYSIIFRVPAPINDKYLKIGGNNYIMIQQLFPKPIQKVNNTTARLYTHYNTTSVILKGSKLDSKDYKQIEQDFIDKLNISPGFKTPMDRKTLDKLQEYNCPLDIGNLLFSRIQF
jgi:hypothetical protein